MVFRLSGTIPASNFVKIKAAHSQNNSLGLTGRYLYIVLCAEKAAKNAIHLDFVMQDGNKGRLLLTNMVDKLTKGGPSKGPAKFPWRHTGVWEIKCYDLEYLLEITDLMAKTHLKRKNRFELESIMLCSDMEVKGIYTSDNLYGHGVIF
jgi:hypothetical protein